MMSAKNDKDEIEIDEIREKDRKNDDSNYRDSYRDISKMQAPEQWPDPPEKVEKSSDGE